MKYCEKAIFELLKTLASGNVFHLRAKQNCPDPFIVYQRVDSTRWRSMTRPSGIAQAVIQVDAYAKDAYAAKDLGASIETILDGYSGTVYHGTASPQDFVKIGGISLQTDSDDIDETDEPLLYKNSARYLVTYEQN